MWAGAEQARPMLFSVRNVIWGCLVWVMFLPADSHPWWAVKTCNARQLWASGGRESEQGCFCHELLFPHSWDYAKPTAQEGTTLPPARLTRAGVRRVLGQERRILSPLCSRGDQHLHSLRMWLCKNDCSLLDLCHGPGVLGKNRRSKVVFYCNLERWATLSMGRWLSSEELSPGMAVLCHVHCVLL